MRPEAGRARLARLGATGFDRRLVHRQRRAGENVRARRCDHGRGQADRVARPVLQAAPADPDAKVRPALTLPVQRQVTTELVDQHPGQETHVRRGTLRHNCQRRRGDQLPGVATLLVSLVAELPRGHLIARCQFDTQRLEHARLNDVVEPPTRLGRASENLPIEPPQLPLDALEQFAEAGNGGAQSRIFLLQTLDRRPRQSDSSTPLRIPESISSGHVRQPGNSVSSPRYRCLRSTRARRCESGRAFRSRARRCSEASLLRTPGPFPMARGVEGENLQHRASPVDEHEPVPARRILAQQVAYQRRPAIEGTPHVRGPRAPPHALLRTGGQHDGARRNRNTIPPPSSGSTSRLARARSGKGAVQGVDPGEQPDVFAGAASSERVSRRRAPATDASANAVPGDEARHLNAGQPGQPGRELANDAVVRAAPPSMAEPTRCPGEKTRP